MPTEIFQASRWTSGNRLFPTVIEVSDKAVTRRKRSWFRQDEMTISLSKVASVHIKTGLIWSDILIESTGGTDPIFSHGHTKGDAQRIKQLIETASVAPLVSRTYSLSETADAIRQLQEGHARGKVVISV